MNFVWGGTALKKQPMLDCQSQSAKPASYDTRCSASCRYHHLLTLFIGSRPSKGHFVLFLFFLKMIYCSFQMFNSIPALPEKTYRLNKLKLQEAFRIIVLHYFSDLRVKIWSHTTQELRAAKFQLRINAANWARTHQGLVAFSCDKNYKHLMHIELTMCMPAHAQPELNWEIFRGVSGETGSITHLSIYSTGPLKFVKSPFTNKTPGSYSPPHIHLSLFAHQNNFLSTPGARRRALAFNLAKTKWMADSKPVKQVNVCLWNKGNKWEQCRGLPFHYKSLKVDWW